MAAVRRHRLRGFTIAEVIIATAIGLVAAGIIIQVMVLTVRTTDQTSSQADVQARARAALLGWEGQLRDGYAVLSSYTAQKGGVAGTTYSSRATATTKTIVAAVPSIDGAGTPCIWRGTHVVFDCIVWTAERSGEGADATWNLARLTFPGAFRMPASYLAFGGSGAPALPFTSLLWGQTTSSSSSSSGGYTIPEMGRKAELSPVSLFTKASDVGVEFRNGNGGLIAPSGSITAPPAVSPAVPLPLWVNGDGALTTTTISVTDVASVFISLRYQRSAQALQSGHKGSVTQSDTQSVTIRLRNKQNW